MDGIKGFLQSRTIWGATVAIVAAVLDALGVARIDDGTQNEIIGLVLKAGEIVGAVVAIWGRVVATKRIV